MKLLKIILLIMVLGFSNTTQAQFWKKIGKKVEKAAERTFNRKVEEKTEKETDKIFDSVFNNQNDKKVLKKKKQKKNKKSKRRELPEISNSDADIDSDVNKKTPSNEFEIYAKFDFIPGDKIMLYDDFSLDNLGDFPSKWNTNGTGELVEIHSEKWFKLAGKSLYIPDTKVLPKNYTIEFDMLTQGIDSKTSSQAKLAIWFEDHNQFNHSKNAAIIEIPLCQYIQIGFEVKNKINNKRGFRNVIEKDVRAAILEPAHISIAVNGKRCRIWFNENKVIDIPRLLPEHITSFKLRPRNVRDGVDNIYITNVKIAASETDFRSTLLSSGKFSTTGILFNAGSDQIKPASYGVLKQIAAALKQDPSIKVTIIGHTDSDGSNAHNLKLSEKRAISVKKALSNQFNIDKNRLQTQGKGEEEPVADNTTTAGKAKNRRVEFIKQ